MGALQDSPNPVPHANGHRLHLLFPSPCTGHRSAGASGSCTPRRCLEFFFFNWQKAGRSRRQEELEADGRKCARRAQGPGRHRQPSGGMGGRDGARQHPRGPLPARQDGDVGMQPRCRPRAPQSRLSCSSLYHGAEPVRGRAHPPQPPHCHRCDSGAAEMTRALADRDVETHVPPSHGHLGATSRPVQPSACGHSGGDKDSDHVTASCASLAPGSPRWSRERLPGRKGLQPPSSSLRAQSVTP